MISRISSPSQATFTKDSDNNYPYEGKYSKPIFLVRYADTVFTVNNDGIKSDWFTSSALARQGKSTAYSAVLPICKFYYANGWPPFLVNVDKNVSWATKISGKFYAPYTDAYRFYFGGSGVVSGFKVDGASYGSTYYMKFSNTDYSGAIRVPFTASTWHSFEFTYDSYRKDNSEKSINEYGLIALWAASVNSVEKIPLSAGVCCGPTVATSGARDGETIKWHTVYNISNVKYSIKKGQIATLDFSVPIVKSDTYSTNGYIISGNDIYDIEHAQTIKRFRKVEYYEGYQNESGTNEYVRKFTGQIKNFKLGYNKDGNDSMTIICEDFGSFTKESFNLYSPTPVDYIQVGYLNSRGNNQYNKLVEGQIKPIAFDGWDVHRFLQVVLTESFIDPTLFYNKRIESKTNGSAISGNYNINYTGATSDSLRFPVNSIYGVAITSSEDSPDDKYNYAPGTGDFYYDIINNFLSPYYFDIYFDANGAPCMKAFGAPSTYYDDRSFTYSITPATRTSINNFKYTYSRIPPVEYGYKRVLGKAISVITNVGPSASGYGNNCAVSIYNNGVLFLTTSFSTYYPYARTYYDGPDETGINPCVQYIPFKYYDYHTVYIAGLGYSVDLDGMLVYDDANVSKVATFNSDSNIASLSADTRSHDMRNEVYVYGKLSGEYVGISDDGTIPPNPNNPIYRYFSSITRDIGSIYNKSASNYVGRPLRMIIQDPGITSTDQANRISYNVLSNYREPSKLVNCSILYHPLLEINDCVAIQDKAKGYVASTNSLWIDGIDTNISVSGGKVKFMTDLELNPTRPPDGLWPKPQVDISTPIANVKLTNCGVRGVKVVPASYSAAFRGVGARTATGFSVTLVNSNRFGFYNLPKRGYIHVFHEASSESRSNNWHDGVKYNEYEEVIYYENPSYLSTASTIRLTNCVRAQQGTYNMANGYSTYMYCATSFNVGIDPYMCDGTGEYPGVEFDLFKNSKVRIAVYGESAIKGADKTLVALLTGNGVESNIETNDAYDKCEWGKVYRFWNCRDDAGTYNNFVTKGEIAAGGWFASEYEVDKTENMGVFTKSSPYSTYHNKEGKFFFEITVVPDDGSQAYTYSTREHTSDYSQDGRIYLRRSCPSEVLFYVSTAGLYHYAPAHIAWGNSEASKGEMSATAMIYKQRLKGQGYYNLNGDLLTSYTTYLTYPYLKDYSNKATSEPLGRGIKILLKDVSYGTWNTTRQHNWIDRFSQRKYTGTINYNVWSYAFVSFTNGNGRKWYFQNRTGVFKKFDEADLYNNGNGLTLYFNPKTFVDSDNKNIDYFTSEMASNIRQDVLNIRGEDYDIPFPPHGGNSSRARIESIIFNNIVFFTANLRDQSGRLVYSALKPETTIRDESEYWANPHTKFSGGFYTLADVPGGAKALPTWEKTNVLYDQNIIGSEYIESRLGNGDVERFSTSGGIFWNRHQPAFFYKENIIIPYIRWYSDAFYGKSVIADSDVYHILNDVGIALAQGVTPRQAFYNEFFIAHSDLLGDQRSLFSFSNVGAEQLRSCSTWFWIPDPNGKCGID